LRREKKSRVSPSFTAFIRGFYEDWGCDAS
jgi:hypothetical protein